MASPGTHRDYFGKAARAAAQPPLVLEGDNETVRRIATWGHALEVADLVDLLALSKRKIYRMVKRGTIPEMDIDGMLRFDPATTVAWARTLIS